MGIYLLLEAGKSTLHGGLIAVITIVGLVTYMILHELTHGLTISLLSKTKSKYAIRFPFLTTGTEAYLNKRSFIIVCLSPSVLFGLIIGILLFFIPQDYFLSLFTIFGLNFAGSSGDYYQTYIVMKTKRESLIKDDGEKTNIFQEIDLFEDQPN